MVTQQHIEEVLGMLISGARAQPDNRLPIRDGTGATVATIEVHALPKRPKDMPRHLRPKQNLSKRERDSAKRDKRDLAALDARSRALA